ncbi:MAG: hypothetical protein ACLRSV_05405 [Oscillospiraceae bacterium]
MKLFGNRRRAAYTKKSALSRGTRTALIAAVIVLAVAGSAFAAWKLLVKPVERPALSEPEPEPPAAETEAPEPSVIHVTPQETRAGAAAGGGRAHRAAQGAARRRV